MSIDSDANDLLQGGAPSAKFPTIGTTIKGTVVSAKKSQQTDIDGKLKFWDDGNPMWQIVITLQTDQRDPSIQNDDGERRLFVKGQMQTALKAALKDAGATGLEVGATLAVQYESDGEAKPGKSAPKVYRGQYVKPVSTGVTAGDLI